MILSGPGYSTYIHSFLNQVLDREQTVYQDDYDKLIRFLTKHPEFNIHDKIALAGAIKYFDGELDKDTNMTGINNQLKKMMRKLEFYEGMRDV